MSKKRIPIKRAVLHHDVATPDSAEDRPPLTIKRRRVDEDRRSEKDKAYSYRIGTPLRNRITALAKAKNVKISQLVKFMLTHALTEIEEGRLDIPIKKVEITKEIDL